MRVSSEVKQRNERTQRYHFNRSEVNQRSERSQRYRFNSSEVKDIIFGDNSSFIRP